MDPLACFGCQIPTNPEALEDEEMDALQEELSADFDVGFAIKENIIPRAVEWWVLGLCCSLLCFLCVTAFRAPGLPAVAPPGACHAYHSSLAWQTHSLTTS